ncbi:MAG: S-methyl-5'-thioadenosine phosphorylase [Candidatus Aminicenantes bacterium]|nr:S-methyl-5'-thioadenosine phosphorylase [Candidatus Aminicenantes bacterium]
MPSKGKTAVKTLRRAARLPEVEIGILGGTGLYDIEGLEDLREIKLKTPFGDPSDAYVVGHLEGRRVAFLSRHGRGHRHMPTDVNFRANIYGFKLFGVERIVSVNSCGSLREDIRPRDIVFADQFFDRTRRPSTFFGRGIVAHIGLAHPVCGDLAGALFEAARGLGLPAHPRGTYLNMEGPAFSTKAESRVYRSWGCDVIGMTSATEARLAREAEICYATMNLVTDYDVWHEEEGPVSVEMILGNLGANVHNARAVIRAALPRIVPQAQSRCDCGAALRNAIVTDRRLIPAATRRILLPLIGKYLKD